MKICITSRGDDLISQLDPRFGRCSYFIFYNSETGNLESVANPNVNDGSGAGIQSAQLVVSKNADLVITGEVGPKAAQILQTANLQVITGKSGKIKEILDQYK
jgi:predicted Fe-Mo cluster-binding NifX family protein